MKPFLRWNSDGSPMPYWFGRWKDGSGKRETSLGKWRGVPPKKGEKHGDAEFEASRGEALATLKRLTEEGKSKAEQTVLLTKIYKARYGGEDLHTLKLTDLISKYDALPKKEDISEERVRRVHNIIKKFLKWMKGKYPAVKDVGALTTAHFKGFLDSVWDEGFSARSWNDHLAILRSVFSKMDVQSAGYRDYLSKLPKKKEDSATVHRRPFDADELTAIYDAAQRIDPDLYPIIVTAACTALRRGDICKMEWSAVDLKEGFVKVKTSKTGVDVEIPIFPRLKAVLDEAYKTKNPASTHIFPKIYTIYCRDADSLNRRLNKVLIEAGFSKPKNGNGKKNDYKYEKIEDFEIALERLEEGMIRKKWLAKKKEKARKILELHYEGLTGKDIAQKLEIAKSLVSWYYNDIENVAKIALISAPKSIDGEKSILANIKEDEQRLHRGSLCGWHSFRTTFCTLALENGVAMDTLRAITGHKQAEIVLKHYDRRGRDARRKAMMEAMPIAITGQEGSVDAEEEEERANIANLLQNASKEQLGAIAEAIKSILTKKK